MTKRMWLPAALLAAGLAGAQEQMVVITPAALLDGPATASGLPAGMNRFERPAKAYASTLVKEGRAGGDAALKIEGEGEYAGATCGTVPIDHTRIYAGRAWFKTTGDTKAFLKLDFYDKDGKYLRSSRSMSPPKGTGWQSVSLCERGWDYSEAARVTLAVGLNGKGGILVDDPELVARPGGAGDNLLRDGSMEVVVGDKLANWSVVQAEKGTVQMVRRSVPVRDGWFALQLQGEAGWAIAQPERVDWVRSKKYTLTGWVRAREGAGALKLSYFDAEGKYIGGTTSPQVRENAWKQVTVAAEPEKFPTAVGLMVGGVGSGPKMDVLFDAFVLRSE
jgi:hypothetical protein